MMWQTILRTFAGRLAKSALLAAMAYAAFGMGSLRADEPMRSPPPNTPAMKAYIDPTTGEFTDTPPPEEVQPRTFVPTDGRALSQEGQVESPIPVPDGGVMIDLKGRLRKPLTATHGPDGKVTVEHK